MENQNLVPNTYSFKYVLRSSGYEKMCRRDDPFSIGFKTGLR